MDLIKAAGYCWAVTEDNRNLRALDTEQWRVIRYYRSKQYKPVKGPHWTVYLLRWVLAAAALTGTFYGVSWAALRLMFG